MSLFSLLLFRRSFVLISLVVSFLIFFVTRPARLIIFFQFRFYQIAALFDGLSDVLVEVQIVFVSVSLCRQHDFFVDRVAFQVVVLFNIGFETVVYNWASRFRKPVLQHLRVIDQIPAAIVRFSFYAICLASFHKYSLYITTSQRSSVSPHSSGTFYPIASSSSDNTSDDALSSITGRCTPWRFFVDQMVPF